MTLNLSCAIRRRGMMRSLLHDEEGSLPGRPGRLEVLLAIGALIVAAVLALFVFDNPYDNERFDPERWAALAPCWDNSDCARGHMVDDLIDGYLLTGLTKSEVEQLIGLPDVPPEHCRSRTESCYALGAHAGLGMKQPAMLYLRYTDDGRLAYARRTR